jgi:hypothetical protein
MDYFPVGEELESEDNSFDSEDISDIYISYFIFPNLYLSVNSYYHISPNMREKGGGEGRLLLNCFGQVYSLEFTTIIYIVIIYLSFQLL